MNDLNIISLLWIAACLFAVGLLVLFITKFLKKDTALISVEKLLKEGYYKKALSVCQKYINDNPNDFLVKFYMGQAYEGLKDYPSAVQFYEKASIAAAMSSQEDVKSQIYLKVADMYRKTKRVNESLGYYVLVLDKDSRNIKALLGASELLFDGKNFKKAKEYLEILVKMKGDNLRARFMLAKSYVHLSQLQEAQEQLEYILENIKIKDDILLNNTSLLLSDVYMGLKAYPKAISILKTLLDDSEHFETVIIKIVDTYLKLNQIQEAADFISRNIGRVSKEKECEIYYIMGAAYFKNKEIYKAVKTWESAYKISSGFKDIKNIVQRYAYLIQNPKLEPLYSDSEKVFEKFITGLLKGSYIKQVVRRENFWVLESGDTSYAIYRKPSPISSTELYEVQKIINQNFHANSKFVLYSLYGVINDSNTSNDYDADKMDLISDSDFIKKVNEIN